MSTGARRRFLSRLCGLLTALALAAPCWGQSVTTYHGSPDRAGNYVAPGLTWARARTIRLDPGFHPRFAGHLYAQPLYWQPPGMAGGELIVATESNTVAAIDARTGGTIWARSLGRPVALSTQPCGNIDPLGITGTPVIDPHSQTLYLDAMAASPVGPRHLVFALALRDGATHPGWPVDVEAALVARRLHFDARVQNQRGALTILGGRVFVPYGGHFGDCGDYRGWVVGIALGNPADVAAWSTRARGGGIWAPGGIASDGHSLFFATGNTFGASEWGDGEAVIRLAPDLARSTRPQDFFAPADWRTLDARDADLGGANPLPLAVPAAGGGTQRLILALGKDRRGYLLAAGNLGGIGGALASGMVANIPIRTAPAAYPVGDRMFVAFQGPGAACPAARRGDGLTVLAVRGGSPPALTTAWCGALDGAGSPVVTTTDGRSEPVVWILGAEGDDRLHGFRGDTGKPLTDGGAGGAMTGLRHFQTLLPAAGRFYVGADGHLYAFLY